MRNKFTYLILFFVLITKAQDSVIDSLKLALKDARHDTMKSYIYLSLGSQEFIRRPDSSLTYWTKAKAITDKNLNNIQLTPTEKKTFIKIKADVLIGLGYLQNMQGNIKVALSYYQESLDLYLQINDMLGASSCLTNMGYVYKDQGNIVSAIEYYGKSLKIQEEIGDRRGAAATLNNLATVYDELRDTLMAFKYYNKSLQIREEINDKLGIAVSLNNLGYYYANKLNFSKALEYFTRSLKLKEEAGDRKGIGASLNNIASVNFKCGDLKNAMSNYVKCLKIQEEVGDRRGISFTYKMMSSIYLISKDYSNALEFGIKSMQISKEIGYPLSIRQAALQLVKIYKETGNYKLALENYELFIQMRDSIANEENKKASIKSQLKYEYEKKAAADSVKAAEEKKVVDAQLKQEKTQRLALYGGLGLVGIFAMFMVNRFRVTNRQKKLIEEQKKTVEAQKHLVEEKQKEILDSIKYARRIQTALITNEFYILKSMTRLRQ